VILRKKIVCPPRKVLIVFVLWASMLICVLLTLGAFLLLYRALMNTTMAMGIRGKQQQQRLGPNSPNTELDGHGDEKEKCQQENADHEIQ
jgi:hypothetical protein